MKHTKSNPCRPNSYERVINDFEMEKVLEGIEFPVKLDEKTFKEIERRIFPNDKFGINVFLLQNNKEYPAIPLRLNKNPNVKIHINFGVILDKEKYHFVYIKKFNELLNSKKTTKYYCYNCLNGFSSKEVLENHRNEGRCWDNEAAQIVLPKNAKVRFKDFYKQLQLPVVIYADLEAFTTKIDKQKGDNTTLYENHKISGIGAFLKSRVPHQR